MSGSSTSILTGTARSGGAVRRGPRMLDAAGVRFAIANGLVLLALPVVQWSGAGVLASDAALVVVAGIASGTSARTIVGLAGPAGVVAWAWATGFVEHEYGVLTFSSADLTRMAASIAGAVVIAVLTCSARALLAAHWSRGRPAPPR